MNLHWLILISLFCHCTSFYSNVKSSNLLSSTAKKLDAAFKKSNLLSNRCIIQCGLRFASCNACSMPISSCESTCEQFAPACVECIAEAAKPCDECALNIAMCFSANCFTACTQTTSTISLPKTIQSTKTSIAPSQTTTYFLSGNPYTYLACVTNRDCKNMFHVCEEEDPSNSNTWFCGCDFSGYECRNNEDCCNNICVSGICSEAGGSSGTVCTVGGGQNCAAGYSCQPVSTSFGVCV